MRARLKFSNSPVSRYLIILMVFYDIERNRESGKNKKNP